MNEMREIVDVASVDRLMMALAILGPIAGLAIGALALPQNRRQGVTRGLAVGLLGTLAFIMWKLYNGITDRLGLDTVKNVVVNLALFVLVGVVAGLLLRRLGFAGSVAPSAAPIEPVNGDGQ